MIDRMTLDYDGPDGYTLHVEGDLDDLLARGTFGKASSAISEEALYEFLDSPQVKGALEHREEGRRERELYDRATPEERDAVLGLADPEPDPLEQADMIRDLGRNK